MSSSKDSSSNSPKITKKQAEKLVKLSKKMGGFIKSRG